MPENTDPLYILARRVLLDALGALGPQRDAITLVGAQAIYLHAGEADLAVAPFTTDGDLLIDPRALRPSPLLGEAMRRAGFVPDPRQPGIWIGSSEITVDLLVAEALGGPGRRGARLGPHGHTVARKARGLEAALVDRALMDVAALDRNDQRGFSVAVAGPAALLVAKMHKLAERQATPSRLSDKDALDIFRLLKGVALQAMAERLTELRSDRLAGEVTREAIDQLQALFSEAEGPGALMAARAASPLLDAHETAASCSLLAQDLLRALQPV
jgi:hypothetical protein